MSFDNKITKLQAETEQIWKIYAVWKVLLPESAKGNNYF